MRPAAICPHPKAKTDQDRALLELARIAILFASLGLMAAFEPPRWGVWTWMTATAFYGRWTVVILATRRPYWRVGDGVDIAEGTGSKALLPPIKAIALSAHRIVPNGAGSRATSLLVWRREQPHDLI